MLEITLVSSTNSQWFIDELCSACKAQSDTFIDTVKINCQAETLIHHVTNIMTWAVSKESGIVNAMCGFLSWRALG